METAGRPTAPAAQVGVSPQLSVRRGREALEFYSAAFGAEEVYRVGGTEDGDEVVAQLSVGSTTFWVADESPPNGNPSPESLGGSTVRLLLVVKSPRSAVERAVALGATLVSPVAEEHGWLLGRIEDPFGHRWEIARPPAEWPPSHGDHQARLGYPLAVSTATGGARDVAGVEREAQVVWEGDLASGSGKIVSETSGALGELPVTWASRTETAEGRTSPEELLAAAYASCFAMAFSHVLTQGGTPPERLDVKARSSFERRSEGGWKISSIDLEVGGRVPGLDADAFGAAAREAEGGCPVSNALRGNVEIRLSPNLDG